MATKLYGSTYISYKIDMKRNVTSAQTKGSTEMLVKTTMRIKYTRPMTLYKGQLRDMAASYSGGYKTVTIRRPYQQYGR